LGLSQNEMIRRMGMADELKQSHISHFESGEREPSLLALLAFARAAGGHRGACRVLEALIDDDLELPSPKQPRSKVRSSNGSHKGKSVSRRK
jgi:transcriptional regulator with XRE-family HTH domain